MLTGAGLCLHGQSQSLFVAEPKSLSFELLFENSCLSAWTADDRLRVAVKRTGQGAWVAEHRGAPTFKRTREQSHHPAAITPGETAKTTKQTLGACRTWD